MALPGLPSVASYPGSELLQDGPLAPPLAGPSAVALWALLHPADDLEGLQVNQQRTGMYATIAAWVSVALALALTLSNGGPFVVLLIATAIIAISVTSYWAGKSQHLS